MSLCWQDCTRCTMRAQDICWLPKDRDRFPVEGRLAWLAVAETHHGLWTKNVLHQTLHLLDLYWLLSDIHISEFKRTSKLRSTLFPSPVAKDKKTLGSVGLVGLYKLSFVQSLVRMLVSTARRHLNLGIEMQSSWSSEELLIVRIYSW